MVSMLLEVVSRHGHPYFSYLLRLYMLLNTHIGKIRNVS
jgi:hypothetical protein